MSIDLFGAACARWDALALHTTISPLRLDKEGGPEGMLRALQVPSGGTSSAANEKLPRCRFAGDGGSLVRTTAKSKQYTQVFILTVYSKSLESLQEWQDLIIDGFENSHLQSVNPFSLTDTESGVNDLDYIEVMKNPSDLEVKYMEIAFRCKYTTQRVFPA